MNLNLRKAIALLIPVFGTLLFSTGSQAQDAGAQTLEEIIVIGSRVQRSIERARPGTALGHVELEDQQRAQLSEVFRDLSINVGSFPGTQGPGANFGGSTGTVNLRGLGARGTLLLVNGNRQTIDSVVGGDGVIAVDVNSLAPSIMVQRTQVLADGASALYGSDAVAGVVNLITRNNFEGIELDYEGSSWDRASTYDSKISGLFGVQGENSGLVVGIEHVDREPQLFVDLYDIDRLNLGANFGNGFPGTYRATSGGGTIPDPLCGDDVIGGVPLGGTPARGRCRQRMPTVNSASSKYERTTALAVFTHEFDNGMSAQVELGGSTIDLNRYQFAPLWNGLRSFPQVVPASNPGVVAENTRSGFTVRDYSIVSGALFPFGERFGNEVSSFGAPPVVGESDTYRFAATLEGDFNDVWSWKATYTKSRNESLWASPDTNPDRLQNALNGFGGPTCNLSGGGASGFGPDTIQGTADDGDVDGSCFWHNPFANQLLASPGDAHYNNPENVLFLVGQRARDGEAELETWEASVSGNPFDWAGFAFGIQRRESSFTTDPNDAYNGGDLLNTADGVPDYAGSSEVDALYGEVVFFPNDDLDIQLAVRHEDYDGSATTDPKISVSWRLMDNLVIRASAGSSFRVANEAQLYGVVRGRGPLAEVNGSNIDAQTITSGDPEIDPETANNISFGVDWDITENINASLKYWSIEMSDLVVEESVDELFADDATDGTIDDPRIILDPAAGTNVLADLTAGDFLLFRTSYRNQDEVETDGIDFTFDWNFDIGENQFSVSLNGTRTMSFDVTQAGVKTDALGYHNALNIAPAIPELKANLAFDWTRGNHYALVTLRHLGEIKQDDPGRQETTEVESYNTVDLLYRYRFDDLFGGPLEVSLGVTNVTDEEDPIVTSTAFSTNQSLLYDPRGRMFRMSLRKSFGGGN